MNKAEQFIRGLNQPAKLHSLQVAPTCSRIGCEAMATRFAQLDKEACSALVASRPQQPVGLAGAIRHATFDGRENHSRQMKPCYVRIPGDFHIVTDADILYPQDRVKGS